MSVPDLVRVGLWVNEHLGQAAYIVIVGSMSKALRTLRMSAGKSFNSLLCESVRWPPFCCRAHSTRHFRILRAKLHDGRAICPNTFNTMTRNIEITISGLPC